MYLQQVVNEVDGLAGDLLPGVGRVHEVRVLDLLMDVLVLVERERAWSILCVQEVVTDFM